MSIRDTLINSLGDLINKDNTNIIFIENINNYSNHSQDSNEITTEQPNDHVNNTTNEHINHTTNRDSRSLHGLNINSSYITPLPPPPLPPPILPRMTSSMYTHNYTRRPTFTSISNFNIPYYRPIRSSFIYQEEKEEETKEEKEEEAKEEKEEEAKEEKEDETKENSEDSDDNLAELIQVENVNSPNLFQETINQDNMFNSNTNYLINDEIEPTLNNIGNMIDSILGTISNMSGELSIEFPVSNILNTSQITSRSQLNSIEHINNQSYLITVNEENKEIYTQEECSICNVNYREGDIIRKFDKCPHYFHYKCIDRWLNTNKNCPVCTVNII